MPDISRLVIEVDSKGVVTATGNLENFSKTSKTAGKGTDDLADKFGAFQLIANKLPGPLKSVASGLMGLVTPATAVVSAFFEIGEAAIKYIKESIDAFAKFEMIKTNLEVVSRSAEEASNTFTKLQQMAVRTPFNVDQLAEAATMLRQTGISAKDLIPTLEMLGNVSGGSSEKFSRISMNFAQIQSTMKATAMDIRQFAMAGVPIYDMLEKMGVTGTATADDITEAFRRMTESGGQFYGAMEKGAQTIQGLKTNLEGLIEQHKALQAQYSGMSDYARSATEAQIKYHSREIELLQEKIELKEIADKKDSGSATFTDLYREAEIMAGQLSEKIENINKSGGKYTREGREVLPGLERQLKLYSDIISRYQPMIDAQNKMISNQEEYNSFLEETDRGYRTLQAKIEETYAKTHEGQKEAIENEIAWWKEEQKRVRYVDVKEYRSGGWAVVGQKQVGIEQNEYAKIDAIIRMLTENLAKAGSRAKEVTKEFASWAHLLSQTTQIDLDWVGTRGGLATVERYAKEGVDAVRNRFEATTPDGGFLYEALGLDRSDIYEDAAGKMRSLVEMMTNARFKEGGSWNIVEDKSYQLAINLLKEYEAVAMEKREEKYLADLGEKLEDTGKSTYELSIKRLMIEEKISEEAAAQALSVQKQIDYLTNGYDIIGSIQESMNSSLVSIRSGEGGYGQYAGMALAQTGMNAIQGTDAGNFAQGTAMGGPLVGLINMLVGAISKVLMSIEGIDEVLSPVTNMLMELKDILKAAQLPGILVARMLVAVGRGLNFVLKVLSFGLIDQLNSMYDSLASTNEERQKEEERLKALNEQYKNLYAALKEQEEYYLQQRRNLNAEWAIENYQTKSVNDMILSPHGAFSTNPKDYIIATKHPETLMGGGGGNVYVNIINNANVNVATQERALSNGAKELEITIGNVVKKGLAIGDFDGAFDTMSARRNGKRQYA